ncbi:MAG: toprim domain-containing protein, partial [Pseudomonadota bacterium]
APDALIDAGLCAKPEDGGAPYDRFRGRILFPIRDGRGRLIAFGGRAMDSNARAKYLNSPETDLFDKGRSLYNQAPAREAVGKGQPLIVAEGYMDVIALAEAGFTGAVAPLGTAITEHQIDMLWRIAPEPIIALDGDTAGLRAAMRLIDIVLPKLEAGRTLRFAIMPEGQDPDDLLKAGGPPAMQARLDEAIPLVSLLWRRETEGQVFDSPERKAALDSKLRQALAKIPDSSVRRHYGDEVNRLRQTLFRPQRSAAPRRDWGPKTAAGASPGAKNSPLAAGADGFGDVLRERVILATLIRHPHLIEAFEDALERMEPLTPETGTILTTLLAAAGADRAQIEEKIGAQSLETLMSQRHVRIAPSVQTDADDDLVRLCLGEEFAIMAARRGAVREIADAMADAPAAEDEGLTWRVKQAAEALHGPRRGEETDGAEFDVAENGVRLNRDERAASRAMFDEILDKTKERGA